MSASAKNASRLAATSKPSARALAPPAHDPHPECPAHLGDDTADPAVGVDAQRLADHGGADRGLPLAGLEALDLLRDMAQRGENEPPRQLRGVIRQPRSRSAHHDALFGARGDVNVIDVAAGLADELERLHLLGRRPGKRRALLQQDDGVRSVQTRRELCGILHRVAVGHDVVALELRKAGERAKGILVVVQNGDFHSTSLLIGAVILPVAN
jgi:hypothetical protein